MEIASFRQLTMPIARSIPTRKRSRRTSLDRTDEDRDADRPRPLARHRCPDFNGAQRIGSDWVARMTSSAAAGGTPPAQPFLPALTAGVDTHEGSPQRPN